VAELGLTLLVAIGIYTSLSFPRSASGSTVKARKKSGASVEEINA